MLLMHDETVFTAPSCTVGTAYLAMWPAEVEWDYQQKDFYYYSRLQVWFHYPVFTWKLNNQVNSLTPLSIYYSRTALILGQTRTCFKNDCRFSYLSFSYNYSRLAWPSAGLGSDHRCIETRSSVLYVPGVENSWARTRLESPQCNQNS